MILCLAFSPLIWASNQWPPASWTEASLPINLVGPVYYVGGAELTSYLITDQAGHVLVNVGMEQNFELVVKSIKQLGIDPLAIKFILNTQAHSDHAGGISAMAALTQATVLAGTGDVQALLNGGINDYAFGDKLEFSPLSEAQVQGVVDKHVISYGAINLTALSTPGHTPGSTSWILDLMIDGRPIKVLFKSSITIPAHVDIQANQIYPKLLKDHQATLRALSNLKVDYVMTDHIIHVKPENTAADAQIQSSWFQGDRALIQQLKVAKAKLEKRLVSH